MPFLALLRIHCVSVCTMMMLCLTAQVFQLNVDVRAGVLTSKSLTAKKGDKPWPVVICDEVMLQMLAKGTARPMNARMSDGTWPKEYLPGGSKQGKVTYPTLKLGVMTL